MVKGVQDPFLTYYHRELTYLRNAGGIFASQYPKIARRLGLSQGESPDPHLERLLESFAFLTARLQQEIDDRVPQIATALLGVLYPQLTEPMPALAVAQFQVDPSKGKLTTGFDIAKQTPLITHAQEGTICRFRTSYPVSLWPIKVVDADFIKADNYSIRGAVPRSPWLLRLKLEASSLTFADLTLENLRFHIAGDRIVSFALYEALFANADRQVFQSTDGRNAEFLGPDSLRPVGFTNEEAVLPCPPYSHPSYQLIQEYFHFPEKFLFFDVQNFRLNDAGKNLEILISLSNTKVIETLSISEDNFLLGCTPVINLFPKTTEPLRLDHRKLEYRLVPDQSREHTTEIHSIHKVSAAVDEVSDTQVFYPYFSFNHPAALQENAVFWYARRAASDRKDIPGTDLHISFVDLGLNLKLPPVQTIYAHTLCTNRFLAEQLPAGATLQLEEKAPISRIVCLDRPVAQVYSPLGGEHLWKLISQLSINHLSLTSGEASVIALKESLRLYAGPATTNRHTEIEEIVGLECTPIVRRIGDQAWRGFVKGINVTLTLNESLHTGNSSFLMANVLRQYLALQVSINSFVELTLKSVQRQGIWMQWNPLSGEQNLL